MPLTAEEQMKKSNSDSQTLASVLADFWMTVGNRMTEIGMTRAELIQLLHCSRQNLSQLRCSSDMKLSTMVAIASHLQLTFVVVRTDDVANIFAARDE